MYFWEDWVESWVYYFYMVDILEIVNEYDVSLENWVLFNLLFSGQLYILCCSEDSFYMLLDDWEKFIMLFNVLN